MKQFMSWDSLARIIGRNRCQPRSTHSHASASNVARCPRFVTQLLITLPLPAMVVTPTGQILDANLAMAALLGFSQVSIKERSLFELVDLTHQSMCTQMLRNVQHNPKVSESEELAFVSATRALLLIRLHMQRIEDSSRLVLGIGQPLSDSLTLLQEIVALNTTLQARNTELTHLTRELQQAQRERESVTNMLVHDIRGPLVATSASLEIIQRGLASTTTPPMITEATAAGMRGLHAVLDLTNDLLDMKKLAAGYRPTMGESFSLIELCSGLRSTLHALLEQQQASLIFKDIEDQVVRGDAHLIQRMLFNLLTNAIRFTPHGGTISIMAHQRYDSLLLTIDDHGPGIAKDQRTHIFEPFVQGAGESRRGTGLGLAFCREVVEAHGGQIWVEEAPGGGGRFCIVLPHGAPEAHMAGTD